MAALTRGHAQFRSSAVATPTPTVSINPSSASIQAALPNQHGPCLNRYADVARLPARCAGTCDLETRPALQKSTRGGVAAAK
jgi:hypothetical protein